MVAFNLFGKGNNVLPEVSNTLGDKKSRENALHSFGSEKHDGLYPWSAVSKEAEALMFLNETATCYSKAKNLSKGILSVFNNCLRLTFPIFCVFAFLLKELCRHLKP